MTKKPERMRQHDKKAIPIVVRLFEQLGFEHHVLGTESDSDTLYEALASQDDLTSIMLRFRPDLVFVQKGLRSVLCEIKSESGKYSNFAIEIDSFRAIREWDTDHNHVIYAFVDLCGKNEAEVSCCWTNQVLLPKIIHVPKRWDFKKNWARLEIEWPGIRLVSEDFEPSPYKSGTPYFLIPKTSLFLSSFGEFMQNEILPSL